MRPLRQHARRNPWPFIRKTETCWLWQGYRNDRGYGRIGSKIAHRIIYELLVGPIPVGLTLDHLCRVRHCVNPAHLEPVDNKTNILRGVSFSAINAKKETCPLGHAYTLRRDGSTHRRRDCLVCKRMRNRSRYR